MAVNYTEEEEATASVNFLVQNNSASKNIFFKLERIYIFLRVYPVDYSH
jgi:hypothetical protein